MSVRARAAALALAPLLAILSCEEAQAQAVCSNNPQPGQRIYCLSSGASDIALDISDISIATTAQGQYGAFLYFLGTSTGSGDIAVTDTTIVTEGRVAYGILLYNLGSGGGTIDLTRSSITTTGNTGHGILAWIAGAGGVDIDLTDTTIAATAPVTPGHVPAHAVYVLNTGTGGVDIDVTGGSLTSRANRGVHSLITTYASTADTDIALTGTTVRAEDRGSIGISGETSGLGSVLLATGAETTVVSPFFAGLAGELRNAANAEGRVVVSHAGAIEAQDFGIFTWARRTSGHTFDGGAQTANDADRTAPMIRVISSGDIEVGLPATDAFIRGRLAGADETLSDAERAVLDAIEAEDTDALDTALAALPADYDAAWKADARNFLSWRVPPAPVGVALASRTAEDMLGIARSGIRASAIDHIGIVNHIRSGDAALAGAGDLSAIERAVLEAVFTGRGLEAALAVLPAVYTDAWKRNVRRLAAGYNAGGIRVDAAGGSISSDGHGMLALYAVPHDRNGAIAVAVGRGARVTGGRSGIYVRGAGAGEGGGPRAQTVRVFGAVAGGTGAGVHMFGGGAATVGAGGEVGATSGVGILADDGGDLTATVSGTVTGDIRVEGGGALTANIMDGGVVTGTLRGDAPASAATVHGRVGRILFDNGGTARVAGGGAVTGLEIDGETETIRAAAGDLSVTVAGRIEGDLRPSGDGALTANVMAGGVVTGTIRNPQTPLAVAGSVGRILYDNGGALTVAANGAITGVETDGETEAIRADAGDLKVAVAGSVTGGIVGSGAGALDVTVSGAVAGDIRGGDAGAHKVSVESGGSVTGTVRLPTNTETTVAGTIGRIRYDNGGAITVNASGKITGLAIEGVTEAIRSDAGDLAVTVHGTIAGNIEARGDGDLMVKISETGTVTGEIFGRGGGTHTIEIAEKATVLGTVHNPKSGTTISGAAGRVLFDNGGALTVAATGRISGIGGEAIRADAGDLAVTVASGGEVTGRIEGRGPGGMTVHVSGAVEGAIHGKGAGKHEVTIASGGAVTGAIVDLDDGDLAVSVAGRLEGSIEERGAGDLTATVTGAATGVIHGRGAGRHEVTIASGGAVTGAIVDLDGGDLVASVAGQLTGAIEERGAGDLTATVTGAVTGAIQGKGPGRHEVTVASGGTVTGAILDLDDGDLAASIAGRLEGSIEERGAGDLTATVTGAVTGDIRGMGAGSHTVSVMEGGSVAGTVRLPSGAMTVAGRVGRVLYDNGGAVTVAASGRIAGVETADGGREAIRSAAGDLTVDVAAMATVAGDIRGEGEGDLDVDVSGTVKGGIFGLGGGEHDVHVQSGGSVEGLIHLEASAVTVDGSAASLRFDRGGTVAVGSEGRIPGLDGRAVYSAAGDLTMTVDGAVTGSVVAGDGFMDRLTVGSGGNFTGNVEGVDFIHIAGRATGTLRVPPGGAVTVPAGGALVGAEDAQGRRMAAVAETGALNLTVDGKVEGAVEAPDAAAASTVTIGAGGAIAGKVTLAGAGSAVAVDGAAQAVDVPRGAVTVGENGRIEEPVAGAAAVTVKAAPGESDAEAVRRVGGGRIDSEAKLTLKREGRTDTVIGIPSDGRVRLGPAPHHRVYEAAPSMLLALNAMPGLGGALASAGALGSAAVVRATVVRAAGVTREAVRGMSWPPRSKTVVRAAGAMSWPPGGRTAARTAGGSSWPPGGGEAVARTAGGSSWPPGGRTVARTAERSSWPGGGKAIVVRVADARRGAWARLHAGGGDRRPASSTAGGAHDLRRYAFDAGMEGAIGDNALVSLSVHHVRGEADTASAEGGSVEVSGTGARISGAWFPAEGWYAGGQVAATLYEADLVSARGGALASDVSGRGYAADMEAGRRIEFGSLAVTPRARASWSHIDMSSFTDAMGDRVALDGRSIKARAGVRVDTAGPVGGVFATVDVERELSGSMGATVADMSLEAEAEATWLILGLGGARAWADGRFILRGAANYAAAGNGNRDFGGRASLTVRF